MTDDRDASAETREREQAESLARIESGSIPLQAERRLREMAASGSSFSSTLSVDEFALCSKLGLQPLGQVLGASVHQVGWQNLPWSASWGGGLIVELDSAEFHQDPIAFRADRERDAETLAHGFATVRITWDRMNVREAKRLRAILDRLSQAPRAA